MLIARTPLRVSLLGGGTDYPNWVAEHGGIVVGGAINKYSFLTAREYPPFGGSKYRFVYSEIETTDTVAEIRHKVIRECLKITDYDVLNKGLELVHFCDLPSQSGTGSSSAFAVGVINVVSSIMGDRLSAERLRKLATEVEQERLHECVGYQDNTFASFGGLNKILFHKNGEVSVLPLRVNGDRINDLQRHLMLIYTGKQRRASEAASKYVPTLTQKCQMQFAQMALATDGEKAIEAGDWKKLGDLIDQNWRLKASLGTSLPDIDKLYVKLRLAGAFGGKLIGAGSGGCFLVVVPPEKRADLVAGLPASMMEIPFSFDFSGSQIIYNTGA